MDVAALAARVSVADPFQQLTGAVQASQDADVAEVGVALFDQALEVQKQLAAQLLQTLGVGGNLDLSA